MSVLSSTRIGSRALIGFAFAALAGAASADTISLDFNLTPNGMERTDWTKDLRVARFDTSLGTLTGIGLHYEWTGKLSGSATNGSAAANAVRIEHDLTLGLTDLDDDLIASADVLSAVFDRTLAVGQTLSYGPVTGSNSGDLSFGGSDPLASLFKGTGNVGLRVFAQGSTGQMANGPISTQIDTFAGVKGRLTYQYAPVPEPASMATLGLGALGILRRRKSGGAR